MSVVKVKARTYRISPAPRDRTDTSDRSIASESPVKPGRPHFKHLSMVSEYGSSQQRYRQDIQDLNETLQSLTRLRGREVAATAREGTAEVPDELHERMLEVLSVDSLLRVEVDLIHSKVQVEAVLTELQAYRARTSSEVVSLPLLSASPVPFAKQVPNSLYSSYKNLSSFDRLTSRQELISLIQKTCSLLFPRDQSRSQRLEKELLAAYEKSLQSEASLCNAIWSECLAAIGAVAGPRRGAGSPTPGDSDLISVQRELEELINVSMETGKSSSQSRVIDGVVKLSQQFRLLIKKLSGEHLMQVAELFWKTAVLLYDQMQRVCQDQITRNREDLKQLLAREESRLSTHMKILTTQCELKLTDSQQENTQLKSHLERLRRDIEHCMSMVSDRDEELQQLRDSGMYSELEKMLAEFVAGAGDDPGDPQLPKSMYGSSPVKGVKFTPTRFGSGDKPEPVLEISTKAAAASPEPLPPPPVISIEPVEALSESDSDDSVSSTTLNQIRQKSTSKSGSLRESVQLHPHLRIQNIILYQLNRHPHIGHVMKPKAVYKLFEGVMDAKFKLDKFDEQQGSESRSLTEFTLDYLYLLNETKTQTLKSAANLVKSIEKMRTEGDKYAGLFHRLLELEEADRCPIELGLFIVKARMAFHELVIRGKGKIAKADIDVGGRVSFAEASDLVFSLFREDREVGEAVLGRIQLPDIDLTDKSRLIFCGKLGKVGRDLKYFFVQADSQKNGSINFAVFAKTCRFALEMNLSPENAILLWNSLTAADSLTYAQLTSLDFKGLASKAHGKQFAVSKLALLTCIIEQFWELRAIDLLRLQAIFLKYDTNGDGVLTFREFSELIDSLEAGRPPSAVVQMFREALELDENVANPDAMSPSAFCEVVLRHQLGGFGKSVFHSKLLHMQGEESVEKTEKHKKKKGKKK